MSDKQQRGLKEIKRIFSGFPSCEVSEENSFITIRILQNRYPNAARIEKGIVEQNKEILKELLEYFQIPFNTVEVDEYISYNLEVKEKA